MGFGYWGLSGLKVWVSRGVGVVPGGLGGLGGFGFSVKGLDIEVWVVSGFGWPRGVGVVSGGLGVLGGVGWSRGV